jgi:broad specificity phosphatase PhoE
MHLNPIGRSPAGRRPIGHLAIAVGRLPLLLVLASCAPGTPAAAGVDAPPGGLSVVGGSVIYLVRHAETAGDRAMDPSDPPLSEAGEARAATLAHALADAGLTSILSTDLQRTRATAAPVAAATGLEVQLYDPSDEPAMRALLERLAGDGGRHLIVGHSNTTPALVRMLGGDPISRIPESEYDRLYVVSVTASGEVISTLLRYGRPGVSADAGAGARE